MAIDNFKSLDEYLKNRRRMVMSVWAGTGIGKSYFGLTAPKPIYFLSLEPDGPYWSLKTALDNGTIKQEDIVIDEVIRNALEGEKVPLVRTMVENAKIYKYMKDIIEEIIEQGDDNGTIVIDTGTTWNQFIQEIEMEAVVRKRQGQNQSIFPFDYAVANKAMKSSVDAIRNSNLNCIITHHASTVYNSKGEETSRIKISANNQLHQWVDVQLQLIYSEQSHERYAVIEKCRIDPTKVGEEIDNPSFDSIVKAIGA